MIVRDKPSVWHLLFAIRGSILPHIYPRLLFIIGLSAAMVAVDRHVLALQHLDATPFAVFGVGLSLFLGFRNNAAYDRWWEGRKLFGALVADLRSFAYETDIFVKNRETREQLLRLSLSFLHLHRLNLRRQPADDLAARALAYAPDLADAPVPPCAALQRISAIIARAHATGEIDGFGARALSARLGNITLNQASAERINSTPLPFAYSLLIFRTSYLYCLLVPLALLGPAGWMTPLFVGIVAYVFFGFAEVTEELVHPFGCTMNALPLDAICRVVEISYAPHLGEAPPPALQPKNFLLT